MSFNLRNIIALLLINILILLGVKAQVGNNLKSEPNQYINRHDTIDEIRSGNTVPDFEMDIINHHIPKTHLFAFSGKFIILDFWATWCSPCINSFPKIQELQNLFRDKLQFLLVNTKSSHDSKESLANFFTRLQLPGGQKFSVPSIINDTVAASLFPHRIIPHYVWINDKMEVTAITSGEFVNKEYISLFIKGKVFNVPQKKDTYLDVSKPIFLKGIDPGKDSFLFSSILTGFQEGMTSSEGITYDRKKGIARIFSTNTSVENLYRQAYPELDGVPQNRLMINSKNVSKYRVKGSWTTSNVRYGYSYELIAASKSIKEARKLMQFDLQKCFGLSLNAQKIISKCYVIKMNDKRLIRLSTDTVFNSNLEADDITEKFIKSSTISDFVNVLNGVLPLPVLDETGLKDKIDILKLPAQMLDIRKLKHALRDNGLDIMELDREIDFIVISEK